MEPRGADAAGLFDAMSPPAYPWARLLSSTPGRASVSPARISSTLPSRSRRDWWFRSLERAQWLYKTERKYSSSASLSAADFSCRTQSPSLSTR